MARIRSVHPEICTDDALALLPAEVERTFVRLWTHLDDEGRCVDDPRLIKAALYPLHDLSVAEVDRDLDQLASVGLIIRYTVEQKHYLSAKPASWTQWQKPRHKYESKHPGPDQGTVRPPQSDGRRTDVGRGTAVVGVEGRGDVEEEGAPTSDASPLTLACGLLADRHLLLNPSKGNRERHRAAVLRGKEADYRKRGCAWLAEHPDGTPEQLAEFLEPTLLAVRPSRPDESTGAAALAMYERNDKRREGDGCPECHGTGWVEPFGEAAVRCDCVMGRKEPA